MKKYILILWVFSFFTFEKLFAEQLKNPFVSEFDYSELENDENYKNNKPSFNKVFLIDNDIYEIKDNTLYKRNRNGDEKLIGGKYMLLTYSHFTYDLYKIGNTLYLYQFMSAEPGVVRNIFVINETDKTFFKIEVSEPCYFSLIRYVKNNEYYLACLNTHNLSDLKYYKVDLAGKKLKELPPEYAENLNFKVLDNKNFNYLIVNNVSDKDIKVLSDRSVKSTYRYEDGKTKKLYTQKCAIMYGNYYWLKSFANHFGRCDFSSADEFIDDKEDIILYSKEEKDKMWSACDIKNKSFLTIDEFCKEIDK